MVDTTSPTAPPSAPKTKLRASAPAFVFSANAPVWQPPSYAATPVVAAAPPAGPILKPTAKEFVPSFLIPAVQPAATTTDVAPVVEQPVAAIEKVSIVVADDVKPKEVVVATAPVAKAEPEAEFHPTSPVSATPSDTTSTSSSNSTPTKEPVKSEGSPTKQQQQQQQPANTTTEPLSPTSRKRRIKYTLAEMLSMEPATCPVPAGLVICVAEPGVVLANRQAFKESKGDSHHRGSDRKQHKSGKKHHKHHKSSSTVADEDLPPVKPLSINEETRWKPKDHKAKANATLTTDEYLAQVQSILNKLSVEKFDRLSDQLIDVAVKSVDVLQGAIDMVVKKAQMEWHFSTMYAELCAKVTRTAMPLIEVSAENGEAEAVSGAKMFRSLLLARCQKEFEVSALQSTATVVDAPTEDGSAAEAEKQLLLKRATLGHIRFIGELFKQGLLSSRTMHECIQRLFGNTDKPDEESLECLCKLLATVGLRLEGRAATVPQEAALIKQYFDIIATLSQAKDKLCTRVRFMLQDLIDMRANKYVSRLKEAKATTIAEVHAQAAREEKQKASSGGSFAPKPKLAKSQSMAQLSQPPSPAAPPSKDGWETVPAKVKLVKSASADIRTLHPPRSDKRIDDSRGKAKLHRGSIERDRRSSLDSRDGPFSSRRPPAVPRSNGPRNTPPSPEKRAAPTPARTEEDLIKVAKRMFKEYVAEQDLAEVQAQLHDALVHTQAVTSTILNFALDQKEAERRAVGPFLNGLASEGLVDAAGIAASLFEIVEMLDDIEIDIPKAGIYLSHMVAPLLVEGVLALEHIDLTPLPPAKQAVMKKHLAQVLNELEVVDAALTDFIQAHNE
ncbi:hypothetical protein H310_12655 [Aphanomyces invadans]|uniref:MI domain-containing protein n=2 Tax=Aphanomyces invadans TaxID=157072 RepID=A0A024TIL8_9STRA|nr:hypothetical protein H310_12655 [Aphanomyces invadans]ETV93411.1 hypothetical protein H310_12655 [Aphanomyces invadans]|eukprot:XP_008878047.1 hypothetical protein H310_12655 [Aphanomyces invadans]